MNQGVHITFLIGKQGQLSAATDSISCDTLQIKQRSAASW